MVFFNVTIRKHLIAMTTVTVANNATSAKLIDASRDIKLFVSGLLSYEVEGFDQTAKTGWDGRSSLFSFKTSSFPAGFAPIIVKKLSAKGIKVNWVKKPLAKPLGPENPVVDSFPHDPRYQYQSDAVTSLLSQGAMVAQISTGGGKSRVAKLAHKRIGRKTLFITTRSVLMYQMRDTYENDLKEKVGVLGDNEWAPVKGFNVAMIQTLAQRIEPLCESNELERFCNAQDTAEAKKIAVHLKLLDKQKVVGLARSKKLQTFRKSIQDARASDAEIIKKIQDKVSKHNERRLEVIEFLKTIDLVILEEAHESSGNGYYNVCMKCSNATYRLALTGTPFMRPDAEGNMRLMAVAGQVGIKVTEKDLIDKGILATPYFVYADTPMPDKLYKTTPWQRAYKFGITENVHRNKLVELHCLNFKRFDLSVMILVQRKTHGELLKQQLTDVGLTVRYIDGDSDQDSRKLALHELTIGKIDVIIGTTILDVGVDVPSVGAIILAGGGKAEIAHRQRIGRGLRAKRTGLNVCFIVDFVDKWNNTLREHAATRRLIVAKTPGFAENVVASFNLPQLFKRKP
jgi:superfamily II DNA or RNA helicase